MKRLFLIAALLVSASTLTFAQTAEELKEAERIKELIKSGALDDIVKSASKDDDEDDDSIANPFDSMPEDAIRGMNDARRKAYAELGTDLAKSGHTLEEMGAQHVKMDSVGIYANIDGKLVAMKHIDDNENRITENTFGSKWILTYNGSTSDYQFTGEAKFRMYFTHDKNSISAYYKMFSNNLGVNDFIVCKFKLKNKKREYIGARNASAAFSDGHTKSKADTAGDVIVSVKKVSENVYDMTVKGTPGEYCLTWNEKDVASRTVFDFTIK